MLELTVTSFALVAVLPLLLIAAVGIRLASPGPVLYLARRIGRDRRRSAPDSPQSIHMPERRRGGYRGREFTMYKFRTMRVASEDGAEPITAWKDSRVFRLGAFLRATKMDELPQLFNIMKGDMSLVGPRPEAPEIVRHHYLGEDLETLQVRPGLTSPGTLYYYMHCEPILAGNEVTQLYADRVLPTKLALDLVYVRNASLGYDVRILLRTVRVLAARAVGRRRFPEVPEMAFLQRRPGATRREDGCDASRIAISR